MRLRGQFALATVAATLPVAAALSWYDAAVQHRAAEGVLAQFTRAEMTRERARCEADPAVFGGELGRHDGPAFDGDHPPPPMPPLGGPPVPPPMPGGRPPMPPPHRARPAVVFAYDPSLRSRNPDAPAVDARLARGLGTHDVAVAPFAWWSDEVVVLVRLPWRGGPCALALARGSTDPSFGAVLPESRLWLLPTLAVFVAMLLVLGPVLRRVQRLKDAVARSASSDYATDVVVDRRDEIGALAGAFNDAGREIRAQLVAKDRRETALREFVASTTHDLMIPMTVLLGHLTTLRERSAEGAAVDERALVSAMDEAHYMSSLVHNLGLSARLDAVSPQLHRSAVDLNALVARVVGRHRPIAREHDVALDSAVPAEPVVVDADVTLVEQAVSNVTYNAVRYNRPGGHVAVILEATAGGGFSLRVIDDGPGVPEGELPRLLERGQRGDAARTRAPEGQGLGLPIALRAAALHGFRLTLQASEYGGLEVRLDGDGAATKQPLT